MHRQPKTATTQLLSATICMSSKSAAIKGFAKGTPFATLLYGVKYSVLHFAVGLASAKCGKEAK